MYLSVMIILLAVVAVDIILIPSLLLQHVTIRTASLLCGCLEPAFRADRGRFQLRLSQLHLQLLILLPQFLAGLVQIDALLREVFNLLEVLLRFEGRLTSCATQLRVLGFELEFLVRQRLTEGLNVILLLL